jgi:hypothetical protein
MVDLEDETSLHHLLAGWVLIAKRARERRHSGRRTTAKNTPKVTAAVNKLVD